MAVRLDRDGPRERLLADVAAGKVDIEGILLPPWFEEKRKEIAAKEAQREADRPRRENEQREQGDLPACAVARSLEPERPRGRLEA